MHKRIGFVLASIHTGSSKGFWSDLAVLSKEHGDALFVFPGGRLECQDEFEFLRNEIYDLANAKNLDGLVSWGSSLGGSISISQVEKFHDRFQDLPFVTYSLKRPGHPNIGFDAYGGMQALVTHMILHHGAKRLAFLRGPGNHEGARLRYKAYVDALSQCHIPFDANLVSDPVAWEDGAKALSQLVDERHLKPGKDFDTLLCSSDMMMFSAGKVLEGMGISIPGDLRLAGFNDSEESLLLECPCTTVRMPVEEMASLSYYQLLDLIDNPRGSDNDTLLPAPLVIRRSCGCPDSLGGEEIARAKFSGNREAFVSWLEERFPGYPVREVVASGDPRMLERTLRAYLQHGGDTLLADEAIGWYERYISGSEQGLHSLLLRQRDFVDRESAYATRMQSRRINSLKSALLCSRSIVSIASICTTHLPDVGITACYLVMHQDAGNRLVGGFDEHGPVGPADLSETTLLPESVSASLTEGVYVVEPLFMENQSLGYVVLKTEEFSGTLIEDLRTSLSSAVKGTMLLDAANKAREAAEKAQRTRSEFFANISNGLRDPLETIATLSQDSPRWGEIKSQLSKANHLLDLSLSQTGALELVEHITTLRPGLPAVKVDSRLFSEVLEAIKEVMEGDGETCAETFQTTVEGLRLTLTSSQPRWMASMNRQDPGFSLAERIMLMEGGTFTLVDNRVQMVFPWPNLQNSETVGRKDARICFVGEDPAAVPALFTSSPFLDAKMVIKDLKMLDGYGAVALDAQSGSFTMQMLVHAMETDEAARKMPILCLNCPQGYDTLVEALKSRFRSVLGGAIFVDGPVIPPGLEKLGIPSDFLMLPSLDAFATYAKERAPALFLTTNVDASRLSSIRSVSQTPILVISEKFDKDAVEKLAAIPNLVIANTCVCDVGSFITRIISIIGGEAILPPLTGVLVKRAIAYLDKNATSQISRWQLAEAINVSEDYLTRIFRKELGISPWDYLNRYRIFLATKLLRQTSLTINEVASESGFQDQAYFCRVFKKTMGVNPGKIRRGKGSSESR